MTDFGRFLVDLGPVLVLAIALLVGAAVFASALNGSYLAPLAVMITVPVQRVVEIDAGIASLTVTQVALAAFFAGALVRFAAGNLALRMDAVTFFSGALVLVYGLSVIVAGDTRDWASETYRWAVTVLFLWTARPYFHRLPAGALVAMLIGLSVGGLVWALAQIARDTGPASFSRNGLLRVYGAFGEPNPFAAFLVAVTIPVIAATIWWPGRRRARILLGFAGTAGLAGAVLTQSRGALFGILAALGLLIFAWIALRAPRFLRVAIPVTTAAAALMVVGLVVASPWSTDNVDVTSGNWADLERRAHWQAAFGMAAENPLLGVGAGGYNAAFRDATTNWHFRIPRGHAHNAYLQVASEAGLVAALFYICLLAAVIGVIWRRLGIDSCDWLRWGVLAVILAMMSHQLFDYLHVLSLGLLYSGLWAAAMSIGPGRTRQLEYNGRS